MTTNRDPNAPDHDGAAKDLVEVDLDFQTLRRFQAEFAPNLSYDGLFVETGEPLPPSTVVRFRVLLPEDFVLVEGTAVVVWAREPGAIPGTLPGMALRFATLGPQSQELIDKIVDTHIATGGMPFEIEPRLDDDVIPSDALAGGTTPRQSEGEDREAAGLEGFKLTIRTAGAPTPGLPPRQEPLFTAEGAETADSGPADEPEGVPVKAVLPDWIVAPTEGETVAAPAERADPAEVKTLVDAPLPSTKALPVVEPVAVPEPPTTDGTAEPIAAEAEKVAVETTPPELPPPEPPPLETPEPVLDVPKLEVPEPEPTETPGGEFEVSLFSPDDTPDETPFHPEAGSAAEVTVMPPDEPAPGRPRRTGLLASIATVVVVVIAIAAWFALRPGEPGGTTEAPTSAVDVVEEALEKLAKATPVIETVEEDKGASEDRTVKTHPPAAVEPPQPTPRPTPAPQFGPADRVVDVSAVGSEHGTRITIRGNGDFGKGTVLISGLTGPPRVLVRIRRIESKYDLLQLDVATSEVLQIRTGYHPEQSPPALFVVLDLVDDQVALGPIEVSGDTIVVNVGKY